jgi:hypothetical protein
LGLRCISGTEHLLTINEATSLILSTAKEKKENEKRERKKVNKLRLEGNSKEDIETIDKAFVKVSNFAEMK